TSSENSKTLAGIRVELITLPELRAEAAILAWVVCVVITNACVVYSMFRKSSEASRVSCVELTNVKSPMADVKSPVRTLASLPPISPSPEFFFNGGCSRQPANSRDSRPSGRYRVPLRGDAGPVEAEGLPHLDGQHDARRQGERRAWSRGDCR